jgi:poly(3-hydroxybutyrate) depolymerase
MFRVLNSLLVLACVAAACLVGPTTGAAAATGLPRLRIGSDYVTGISSGGYMATQLQVAYSSRFSAAGIFSAGPYYCAKDSLVIALEACTSPQVIPDDVAGSIAYTDQAARSGAIDPTRNLAHQRTWLFHGTKDTVVATQVADDLATYYRHYGVPLTYSHSAPAGHAWISPLGPNPCGVNQSPYVNRCGFDAESQMLGTMFGAAPVPPNRGRPHGTLLAFSQDPYAVAPRPGDGDVTRGGAAAIGMGPTGYVYIPDSCRHGHTCRLVLALHGCLQSAGTIGRTFVTHSFLNQYADTNGLVVLYPQTEADTTLGNPKGCWDWWGYLGPADTDYATRSGPQMVTVMNMVRALGG